jgi:hypothetical protein
MAELRGGAMSASAKFRLRGTDWGRALIMPTGQVKRICGGRPVRGFSWHVVLLSVTVFWQRA